MCYPQKSNILQLFEMVWELANCWFNIAVLFFVVSFWILLLCLVNVLHYFYEIFVALNAFHLFIIFFILFIIQYYNWLFYKWIYIDNNFQQWPKYSNRFIRIKTVLIHNYIWLIVGKTFSKSVVRYIIFTFIFAFMLSFLTYSIFASVFWNRLKTPGIITHCSCCFYLFLSIFKSIAYCARSIKH